MVFRTILFTLVLSFSLNALAQCLDPVDDEYLVVTQHPELVLSSTQISSKASSSEHLFIYNHQKNLMSFKTTNATSKNLNASTLVLNLTPSQLQKVKLIDNTSITQNCYVEPFETADSLFSNEPHYSNQWGLKSVFADLDMSKFQNSSEVVVAVSDTGFDTAHEDLNSKLWVNTQELNGLPGVDDDGNGCIDDIHGCDVTVQNGNVGINTYKTNLIDHGTHVAGIIGANSNNGLGMVGATVNSKLMLVKSFSSKRRTTSSDLLKSIYYAVDNKADIINCSWGTSASPTTAEFNAFEYARINNVIAVTAAGNSSTYASRTSPAGLTNVLTVGSHSSRNLLSTFSNFGEAVDILAPGGDGSERRNESILSLGIQDVYIGKKGTSMSAPFISAALANLKSVYPDLTRNELINILLLSADQKSVQAYFDPKYKDDVNFLNFKNSLDLAEDYVSGAYTDDLNYEPKEILKPKDVVSLETAFDDRSPTSNNSGSGCSNNLQSEATNFSWLLLFIPFLLIQIKKRTLK